MNDVILLVASTQGVDDYGDPVCRETSRQVFCEVASIGQKEFYQAHATGLKPEIKFRLADYLDYQDEKIVLHAEKRYRVLRTYRSGQTLEITCYSEVNQS